MKYTASILAIALLLLATPASSQDYISAHLQDFYDFVENNYIVNLPEEESRNLTVVQWAWIYGKAFEKEYEWVSTHTVERTRLERQQYLNLLWEELFDHAALMVREYYPDVSDETIRVLIIHGFYGYDQFGEMRQLYTNLRLNSPIPQEFLVYRNTHPRGGEIFLIDSAPNRGYYRPWSQSIETWLGTSVDQNLILEQPGESYAKNWSGGSGNGGLSSDVISGRTTGSSTSSGSGPDPQRGGDSTDTTDGQIVVDDDYEVEANLANGIWRREGANGYVELRLNISGRGGSLSAITSKRKSLGTSFLLCIAQ